MLHERGQGIILDDPVEPIYEKRYLPRKFKIGGETLPSGTTEDKAKRHRTAGA